MEKGDIEYCDKSPIKAIFRKYGPVFFLCTEQYQQLFLSCGWQQNESFRLVP